MAFWNDPTTILPKQAYRWVISFGLLPKFFAKSAERPSYELPVQEAKILYSHSVKFPKRVVWKPITIVFYDAQLRNSVIQEEGQYFYKEFKTKIPRENGDFDIYEGGRTIVSGSVYGNIKEKKFPEHKIDLRGENVSTSTQIKFYKFLLDMGYSDPNINNEDTFKTYTFKQDINEVFDEMKLIELDDLGTEKETWHIYNPLISSVTFDKLDYSSEEILKITVTVNYDWAELTSNNASIRIDAVSEYQKKINMRDRVDLGGARERILPSQKISGSLGDFNIIDNIKSTV